jgi:TolB-like protein
MQKNEEINMKNPVFVFLFAIFGTAVFAQQLPTVAVAPFEPTGGITQTEANNITQLFMNEFAAKGVVKLVDRQSFDKIMAEMKFQVDDWSNSEKTTQFGQALNASMLVRGQVMKMGNIIFISTTMIDVKTTQILYTANTQLNDWGELLTKVADLGTQITDKMPQPNYFIGNWTSNSGSDVMRISFYDNGTISVYHRSGNKEFWGNGNYALDSNKIDIAMSVVTDYTYVTNTRKNMSTSSQYIFNQGKTSFELKNSSLGFTTFIKQ